MTAGPVPEDQVPNDERMTPAELRMVREYLGLSQQWVLDRLGVHQRTIRHWESGRNHIPDGVRLQLEAWEDDTAAQVGRLVTPLLDARDPVLVVPQTDEECAATGWPARWWRHVAARVAVEVPGLSITYRERP